MIWNILQTNTNVELIHCFRKFLERVLNQKIGRIVFLTCRKLIQEIFRVSTGRGCLLQSSSWRFNSFSNNLFTFKWNYIMFHQDKIVLDSSDSLRWMIILRTFKTIYTITKNIFWQDLLKYFHIEFTQEWFVWIAFKKLPIEKELPLTMTAFGHQLWPLVEGWEVVRVENTGFLSKTQKAHFGFFGVGWGQGDHRKV